MPIFQDDRQLVARLKVLRICFFLIFILLFVKLWYVGIIKAGYYREQARLNHVRVIPMLAPRGLILDREGRVLVDNVQSSNLVLFREKTDNLEETMEFLKRLNLSREEFERRMRVARGYPKYQSLVIKENLSMAEMAFLLAHQNEHPELAIVEEPRRLYRYGQLAAHALGYVGEISEKQLKQAAFANRQPGDIVGVFGVERTYDSILSGDDGQRRVLVNCTGRTIEALQAIEPVAGNSLTTTLDLDLQMIAEAELGADPGAVVAFNPINGEILVMASHPAYDPNVFAKRISKDEWARLNSDLDHPLQNRAIQAEFSPGSTFKVVMALAGLEKGVIDQNTVVHCSGGVELYGHYFHCWKPGGHGDVNLSEAIRQSCNVYFYQLGQKLGIEQIEEFSKRVGLGELSGVDLPGEALGLVPSEAWKKRTTGQKWYAGETISVAIGQGPMNVTPIQLARAFGIIATGRIPPLHLSAQAHAPASGSAKPFLREDHLAAVRAGMWRVVNEWGTGQAARVQGFEVCGKTGTAQIIGNATKERLSAATARKYLPNAWFVGFAPRDNPEIVIAVIVQRAESGGAGVAAPIAGKILQKYFEKRNQRQQPVAPPMQVATNLQGTTRAADTQGARIEQ
jgi:penicillin-binding protein 2